MTTDEEALSKRLYISGIAETLTKDELERRLSGYGEVHSPVELNAKNRATTGVFGHCTLTVTSLQWKRLQKLSGSVLKGSRLSIEEAKPDWKSRRTQQLETSDSIVPRKRKRADCNVATAYESRRTRRGEVIKDGMVSQKSKLSGWSKGKYGRAIAVMRSTKELAKNDGLTKLWGTAHPSSGDLTAWYDDEFEEWHDRRNRIMKNIEPKQKLQNVEGHESGNVEVWDDNGDAVERVEINEAELVAQLAQEKTFGLNLLDSLFPDQEAEEKAQVQKVERRKKRDELNIVERYDPAADYPSSSHSDAEEPDSRSQDDRDATIERQNPENLTMEHDNEQAEEIQIAYDPESPDLIAEPESLTSIFKPKLTIDEKFTLFGGNDDIEETQMAEAPMIEIHPDREHQQSTLEDNNINANYITLTKDRGFSQSAGAAKRAFPFICYSVPDDLPHFFLESIDHAKVKAEWEVNRVDLTRDWKAKHREGLRKVRKAKTRQGI